MFTRNDTSHVEQPWLARYSPNVPTTLTYPDEPAHWLLEHTAGLLPARIACQYLEQQLTYAQLLTQARQTADMLRQRGLQPGERVGLLLPNIPEFLIAQFGTWMAGGVVVPLNPLLVVDEVTGLLRATNCRFVVTLDVLMSLVSPQVPLDAIFVTSLQDRLPRWQRLGYTLVRLRRNGFRHPHRKTAVESFTKCVAAGDPLAAIHHSHPDDPATIQPTGGTTGHPKGVLLTHRNLLANALQVFHWTESRFGEDVTLAILPYFHCYGMMACGLSAMARGATVILYHRFRVAKILQLIERWKPTSFPVVPAMLVALNEALRAKRHDLSSLQLCMSGGAPLDRSVADEFARHSGAVVVEGYGLSEAGPVTHVGPLDGSARPGTIGLPLPDTDARIVDAQTGERELPPGEVGELIVRGPQVMAGYWNDPDLTARPPRRLALHRRSGESRRRWFFPRR